MIIKNFVIPQNWELLKLSEVGEVIGGGTPDTKNEDYWEGDISWVTPTEITHLNGKHILSTLRRITRLGLEKSSARLIPSNSLLLTSRASIGYCAINKTEICTNQGFQNIVPNEWIKVDFLYYMIQSHLAQRQLARSAYGSTFKEVPNKDMKKIKILVPSIPEQQKITSYLSKLDDIINLTQKIIDQLQALKKGLMQRLFTEGIGHTEFKETRLGKIPKEWEIKKLGDIINIYDSERIPLSQAERNERKGNYPYCGATGIIDYIDDYLFDGEYVLLAEDGGPFGKFENSAYLMNGKFWVNNHAHIIQAIHGKTTNLYLLYVLNYLSLLPYIVGSTRQKLNQGDLKKIKIPVPSLAEQEFIAKILSDLDNKTENENILKKILKKIKRGLMQNLLTGKKRVKIN